MKKIYGTIFIMLLLAGCATQVESVNRSYPVLENVSDTVSYAYAGNNEKTHEENYEVIGEFTTIFNKKNTPRKENIALAVENLDETIILPGEVFSYNETVGPTTKEKGFKLAKIFIKGNESKGYGGGVCQVSTTLYNAVLEANMDIIERHPHSKDVAYVDEGKDAAVSYGGIDFKFANTLDVPIKINADITSNEITVKILSL